MSVVDEAVLTLPERVRNWFGPNLRGFIASRQPSVWLIAIIVGFGAGVLAILFREAIGLVQYLWVQERHEALVSAVAGKPWFVIFLGPVIAGAAVGLLLERISIRRTGGVADVIEARTRNRPGMSKRDGSLSALITIISLGGGASAGREGPVVHLGATLAAALVRGLELPIWSRRTLLGAGAASAIAASFNAPIAGVLFAHEVILDHYSRRSFVPIVIASAVGSVLSRLWFGTDVAFEVPDLAVVSLLEFPAFAILGVVSALVAIAFQMALFSADTLARGIAIPLFARPIIGGVIVGGIGVAFPQILGVGYETTSLVLAGSITLGTMLLLLTLKIVATAVTLASRFGGGVFSPALYLGAMTGASFGAIAGSIFPSLASSTGLYAVLGMGAVAGAVLGAPLSTTVIVFELTGGFALSVALLLCVAVAYGITYAIHGRSWFQWQLETRGINLAHGPHGQLTKTVKVMDFMDMPTEDNPIEPVSEERLAQALKPNDSIESALRQFDTTGLSRLPVVAPDEPSRVIATATQVRALRYFNRALISAAEEEHR